MIIDAHVHITEDGKWFNTDVDASLGRLITYLDERHVDKAVILPIAPFVSNKFVADVCREYPDKFMGFASVDPQDNNAVNELEESVVRYNLKGLKLHPRFQGFQLPHQNVKLLIKKAAELRIPVLIDAWFKTRDKKNGDFFDYITQIARDTPSSNIILPHLCGYEHNEILQIARENDNIYFDISFLLTKFDRKTISNNIVPIIREIGANRLIYGSDFPEIDLRAYLDASQIVLNEVGFTSEEIKMVFSGTILSLIKGSD